MQRLKNNILFIGMMFLLFFGAWSVDVSATEGDLQSEYKMGYSEFTEDDYYDPLYYMPVGTSRDKMEECQLSAESGEDAFLIIEEEVDAQGESDISFSEFENYLLGQFQELETSIDVTEYNIPSSEFEVYYWQVIRNHPEIYYVSTSFLYSYSTLTNNVMYVTPVYADGFTKENIQQGNDQMQAVAQEAIDAIPDGEQFEDYEKALFIHDWLAVHCAYDSENLEAKKVPAIDHSAYGALVNCVAVCDGYANAYKYILNMLGIECELAVSQSMSHGWNLVKIDEDYYHVDVTWDDPTYDTIGRTGHEYFLLSDDTITNMKHYGWASAHVADSTIYESALWTDTVGSIIWNNSTWYYVEQSDQALMFYLIKTSNLLSGDESQVHAFSNIWYANDEKTSYYSRAYSFPCSFRNGIVLNDAKAIYYMPFSSETVSLVYTPSNENLELPSYNIYGFDMQGKTMRYVITDAPSTNQKELIVTADYPVDEELSGTAVISGIAEYGKTLTANVELTVGDENRVKYQWYADDAAIPDATGETYIITKNEIGKYIHVEITHPEYSASVVSSKTSAVQKISPEQPLDIPTYTDAVYGSKLSSLVLPEGYTWASPNTVMSQLGPNDYTAIYCPDSSVYLGLNITIRVTAKTEFVGTITIGGDAVYKGTLKAKPELTQGNVDDVTYAWFVDGELVLGETTDTFDINDKDAIGKTIRVEIRGTYYNNTLSATTEEVAKAQPTSPGTEALNASYGKTLSTIMLPDGYTWVNPETVIEVLGDVTFAAYYCPDSSCYENALVMLSVTVVCSEHVWDNGTVTEEATETETGVMTYTCEICGETKTEVIPKLLPKLTGTVTVSGNAIYGEELLAVPETNASIDILKYQWYSGAVAVEGATEKRYHLTENDIGKYIMVEVTAEGYRESIKKNTESMVSKAQPTLSGTEPVLNGIFGADLSSVLLPKGYTWESPDIIMNQIGQNSYTAYYCPDSSCYETLPVELEVNVACGEHVWDDGVVTKEATVTETGTKYYKCIYCDETMMETIPKLEITTSPGTTEKPANGADTTVTLPGDTSGIEDGDGNSTPIQDNPQDTKEDEKDADDEVSVGTTVATSTGNYVITVSSDEKTEVEFTGPKSKNAAKITIPSAIEIDGMEYEVTSIAESAFANNKKLKTVTIGKNVNTIGNKAFYKCISLKKITIPKNVSKIGKYAFYGCKNLKKITIKTTKLAKSKVGKQAFKGIYKKATIKVPKSKLKTYKSMLKARGVTKYAKIKK